MSRAQQVNLLRSALALAGRGWHVFPCVPGGKQPALRGNWQDLATTDPATVCRWWARRLCNIGIACGPSGLVVLDLDVPKNPSHPQVSGMKSLARLCEQARQPYPLSTFTVATPSGGCHLYFTAAGSAVPNSASRLGPCIDVRADGGYVVGPGSAIGGRAYAVRNDALPAPLPSWIASELRRRPALPGASRDVPQTGRRREAAYAMAALREETRRVATASKGTRNDTLNLAALQPRPARRSPPPARRSGSHLAGRRRRPRRRTRSRSPLHHPLRHDRRRPPPPPGPACANPRHPTTPAAARPTGQADTTACPLTLFRPAP